MKTNSFVVLLIKSVFIFVRPTYFFLPTISLMSRHLGGCLPVPVIPVHPSWPTHLYIYFFFLTEGDWLATPRCTTKFFILGQCLDDEKASQSRQSNKAICMLTVQMWSLEIDPTHGILNMCIALHSFTYSFFQVACHHVASVTQLNNIGKLLWCIMPSVLHSLPCSVKVLNLQNDQLDYLT